MDIIQELNRISSKPIVSINPHTKTEPRKIRRAKTREANRKAKSEAQSLGAARNKDIHNSQRGKVVNR